MSFVFIASTISCKEKSQDKGEIKVVSPEEMETLLELDDVQLVDVRTPKEYNNGTIKNAININVLDANFTNNINKLDKTQPILIFCKSGGRSSRALKQMKDLGFTHVLEPLLFSHQTYLSWAMLGPCTEHG